MDEDLLFDLVKRRSKITWTDEDSDADIQSIIDEGLIVLRERIGIPEYRSSVFLEPGIEQMLLLCYCYYAWNAATDEFYLNYERDIAAARRKWEVLQWSEDESAETDAEDEESSNGETDEESGTEDESAEEDEESGDA